MTDLYLASQSPRRAELLSQIGVRFEKVDVRVDESKSQGESAQQLVTRLALEKARAGSVKLDGGRPVLGADTIVSLGESVLGKPENRSDSIKMLERLSGAWHEVLTGIALSDQNNEHVNYVRTSVKFRDITPEEMSLYWNTGEAKDKAGGYAIQGFAAVFVEQISGSYSNVVGLPLMETASLLRDAGVEIWKTPRQLYSYGK